MIHEFTGLIAQVKTDCYTVAEQRPGKGGGEKHEIYAAAFGGHLFCDLFSQGRHPRPHGSATASSSMRMLKGQHRIQRLGRGGKKHEIYVATFGGHLFYDLFLQGGGGHGPLGTPPGSATEGIRLEISSYLIFKQTVLQVTEP